MNNSCNTTAAKKQCTESQLRAYKNYYNKVRNDDEYKADKKKRALDYYERNKDIIKQKNKLKRQEQKQARQELDKLKKIIQQHGINVN